MPSCEPARSRAPLPWANITPILAILCLLLSGCAARRDVPDAVAIARLGPDGPLLPLFRGLSGLEDRTRTAPVTILQIGDSHTANDSFSGRLREQFQARFGDAGRGTLHAGVPFRWYRPDRVTADSDGWTVLRAGRAPGPMGVAALRQHADGPADMTLSTNDPADQTFVSLEFLAQPGGGSVNIQSATGWTTRLSTNAATTGPRWVDLPKGAGGGTVTVSAQGDAPVDMLSWTTTRGGPGVIVSNLGTIGATVDMILEMDPALLHQELARLSPTLVLVAFGTNEGFGPGTEAESYRQRFAQAIHMLRAAAPAAGIVVLGPPDSEKATPKHFKGRTTCGDSRWEEPPRLALVRSIQQQVAAREGLFFWDWQAAMGGPCTIGRWAAMHPPMAARDHVHLLQPGYRATADILFQALMDGYNKFRALRPAT
jgi:lysophospholipase L1-like esterase